MKFSLPIRLFAFLAAAPLSLAQTTSAVSVDSMGALAQGRSGAPAISADGTCIAFESLANNLVPGDTNGFNGDVFVRDLASGTTSRVSVSSSGGQGNGHSLTPAISGDGRFVAFSSSASNLVFPDQNGVGDVFLHDRNSGQTSLISVTPSQTSGNGGSGGASLSFDGRYVAFLSGADDLVPGDTNLALDVFVRDMVTGQTRRVSVDSAGVEGNGACFDPSISGDGRFVAFYSSGDNLVVGDTNGKFDVFVHDLQNGVTERVSVGQGGSEAKDSSWTPSLSFDGRFVAFDSFAPNLIVGDNNGTSDVFVYDRLLGQMERASLNSSGTESNGYCEAPSISADGRHVAFPSLSTNLVVGDDNAKRDIFVRDRLLGITVRASVAPSETETDDFSGDVSLSADGRALAYQSWATNLVAGDTNGQWDVFLTERPIAGGGVTCGGAGSSNPCPCGNVAAEGEGCQHSLGMGARIGMYGSRSVSEGDLVVAGEQLVPGVPALLFAGTTLLGGGSGTAFGDGLLCAGGIVVRLEVRIIDGGGVGLWGPDLASQGGWSAGDTRHLQVWYRDTLGSLCGVRFNTTPALSVTFAP